MEINYKDTRNQIMQLYYNTGISNDKHNLKSKQPYG